MAIQLPLVRNTALQIVPPHMYRDRHYTVPRGCASTALASRCDLQHNLTFPQLCREMYAFLQSVDYFLLPCLSALFIKNLTFTLPDIFI